MRVYALWKFKGILLVTFVLGLAVSYMLFLLSKNPIQYSKIKYIEIRHHFVRDHVQNKNIILEFVPTEE